MPLGLWLEEACGREESFSEGLVIGVRGSRGVNGEGGIASLELRKGRLGCRFICRVLRAMLTKASYMI